MEPVTRYDHHEVEYRALSAKITCMACSAHLGHALHLLCWFCHVVPTALELAADFWTVPRVAVAVPLPAGVGLPHPEAAVVRQSETQSQIFAGV